MLLDIGQIDGVTFHQKLDCRPKDQESATKIANTSKAFLASPPRFQNRILPQSLGRGGLSTALMPTKFR